MKPLWRVLVLVVGLVVLLAGAVMLVTPGPGIAVILLGLTILATEFRWARYWLVMLKRRALAAARRVRARARRRRPADPSNRMPADPADSSNRRPTDPGGRPEAETPGPRMASKAATEAREGEHR